MTTINYDPTILKENNINLMPCSIDFDGKAKVNNYFKEKCDPNNVKSASFRGRPLKGYEFIIPEGFCGYIMQKSNVNSNQNKEINIQAFFKKMNFWNLDREYSKDDPIVSALDWFEISNALHSK